MELNRFAFSQRPRREWRMCNPSAMAIKIAINQSARMIVVAMGKAFNCLMVKAKVAKAKTITQTVNNQLPVKLSRKKYCQ
jgi:hypothetical protein